MGQRKDEIHQGRVARRPYADIAVSQMSRRGFLLAGVVGGALALSGCS